MKQFLKNVANKMSKKTVTGSNLGQPGGGGGGGSVDSRGSKMFWQIYLMP